jgi:transcriptional regulator with XRE-family HTH domain
MKEYKNFGDMLHDERISKGKTLREFCRENDFDPARLSKIENNLLKVPKDKKFIKKIASALDVDLNSDDYKYIIDLASASRGEVPEDFSSYMALLPAFCRKARMDNVEEEDIQKLVNIIRQSNSDDKSENKIKTGNRAKSK